MTFRHRGAAYDIDSVEPTFEDHLSLERPKETVRTNSEPQQALIRHEDTTKEPQMQILSFPVSMVNLCPLTGAKLMIH